MLLFVFLVVITVALTIELYRLYHIGGESILDVAWFGVILFTHNLAVVFLVVQSYTLFS